MQALTNFLDSFYYLMFNNCQQRRGEPLQILVVRNLKAVEVDLKIRPCRPETRWVAGPTWPFYLYFIKRGQYDEKSLFVHNNHVSLSCFCL